jgi:hypothetical protein
MDEQLRKHVSEIIEGGAGERLGESPYLPVLRLESDARLGVDAQGRWVLVPAGASELVAFGPGAEPRFVEVVELDRDDFEHQVSDQANALGLDAVAVLLSFPAVPLIRSLLQSESSHVLRLALEWLLPSELREARAEIDAVAANRLLPQAVRDLARRLTVPE